MTYRLNPELAKIESPVILVLGETETTYPNGAALAELAFDTHYIIESVAARNNQVVVTLQPNAKMNDVNWIGEEQASFF